MRTEISDILFNDILDHGVCFLIETGVSCGYLKNKEEGVYFIKKLINYYEQMDEFEKCSLIYNQLNGCL